LKRNKLSQCFFFLSNFYQENFLSKAEARSDLVLKQGDSDSCFCLYFPSFWSAFVAIHLSPARTNEGKARSHPMQSIFVVVFCSLLKDFFGFLPLFAFPLEQEIDRLMDKDKTP